MKKMSLLLPAILLACASCNSDSYRDKREVRSNRISETSSDWEITTKVKDEIISDSSISGSGNWVSVSTKNGIVTLSGNAPTIEDRDKIVRIAKKVKGVKGVNNQILVNN